MNTADLFYFTVSICVIIITGVIVLVGIQIKSTLLKLNGIVEDIKDTTQDIRSVKNSVKLGVLNIISMGLKKLGR